MRIPDVTTMETTDSSIYIRLIPAQNQQRRMSDSDKDRPLLDELVFDDKSNNPRRRHACTGRFLTMHKRRRKKLQTRALLQDTAILDDVLHGQVQCILNQVGNWRFNAFTLETVTGGRSLPVLCVHLFHWYGLLDHFNLDVVRLWKLFSLIEEGYHSTNPYHNSIHATDVTQAMHCFIQESTILEHLEPIEVMASLLGAVTHDLDHPGVNQPFLIATSNHLAALYENTSVLENHHWRSAVGCLLESGVAEQIQDIRPALENQISSLILATDITRQQEFLTKLRNYLDTDTLDLRLPEHRHFVLQIALKSADISNPCRPWDVSKKWSQKVCEEFFRQGDYERQLNLPVTSLCDRYSTSVPKIQVGFIKFVVTPLFDEWHRFLDSKLSRKMMRNIKHNLIQWEAKVAAELAEETRTEISDAEALEHEVDDDDDEDEGGEVGKLSDSSEGLLPEVKDTRRSSLQVPSFGALRMDRRNSAPVNPPPKIILPLKGQRSRDAIREDMEARFDNDTFSMLSTDSDSFAKGRSSDNSVPDKERPLSAETLVPDLSIAAMSNSACADQLNMVMHGACSMNNTNMLTASTATKQLIRQQTFPPLQPYVRARYMSAAADMGTSCAETLIETKSNSSDSPCEYEPRGVLVSKKESFKREQDAYQMEKSCKIAKISIEPGQKENLDPSITKKNSTRRRGSAPVVVVLPSKTTNEDSSVLTKTEAFIRRGSMPAPVNRNTSDNGAIQPDSQYATNVSLIQRRGSVPCDSYGGYSRNACNGKNRNRKKLLRRRSSGGAEILSPILAEPDDGAGESSSVSSSSWYCFKREMTRNRSDLDTLLSKRRGSLPVEVLAVCHTVQSSLSATQSPLLATQSSLSETQSSLSPTQSTLSATQSSLSAIQSSLSATQSSLSTTQSSLPATQSSLSATQSSLSATQTCTITASSI
ncbi:High affinity cAMP-specific 3',5'-cyclic phosphodiesterase 7A [Pseudolycoriella hygida]|uniref:Phosphodiesterase n=1 Tax=Pseudolycoriella hygida TaxID=35572 RepID=A0A9Q0N7G2_9DIPT|nr:High affinity cAMP-specific 3',5'-cyclic phosphodiesterase 7A [Pseudolycoriella hygida]